MKRKMVLNLSVGELFRLAGRLGVYSVNYPTLFQFRLAVLDEWLRRPDVGQS